MSAFVVEDKTINRVIFHLTTNRDLSWYADKYRLREGNGNVEAFGKALFDLNCAAVEARYGKGEAAKFRRLNYKYKTEPCRNIQALKSLRCLIYQCSEGDIPKTDLYKFLDELSFEIALEIIRRMPEYDEADWG